ncbi:hypothetical protein [Ottowia sp.]|uniref:hypothetical protein n=1 Tax=Ottowia sp. TaxID=1898956 RepID=UPI0025E1A2E0|nr:hypothetical protein [Ottowia sp.]MBK6616227.1 hypothetical protein [Ottowia sp.]
MMSSKQRAEAENPPALSQAVLDVLAERARQVGDKGYTPDHDDEKTDGAIALAGAGYAYAAAWHDMEPTDAFTEEDPPEFWPDEWDFKPGAPRDMLVKATALLLAEIERRDRPAASRPWRRGIPTG